MSLTRLQSRLALPAVLLAIVLSSAAAASADVGETIILRCTNGKSLAGFSQSAYNKALNGLSADSEEESNCSQLIRRRGSRRPVDGPAPEERQGAPESASAVATTPAERRPSARAAHAGSAPVPVDAAGHQTGVVHGEHGVGAGSLPSPLLRAIVFLLACLIILAGGCVRSRFRGDRPD